MSKAHSIYAWGVVVVVIISTVFLLLFGKENWQWLSLMWTAVPLTSCLLFLKSKIPPLKTPEKASNVISLIKRKEFIICFLCIFFGGASECTMSQWSSSYLEQALHIPKIWGDIFGVAVFALTLGLGRTLYAKYGKNINKTLAASAIGATVCYLVAAVSSIPLIGLIACAFAGFATAMLWPGCLIMASDKFPSAGVTVYALMAAGGDLGGAVGPQLVGVITDVAAVNGSVQRYAEAFNMTGDQLAMKIGLISATVFPLAAAVLFIMNYKKQLKNHKSVLRWPWITL